MANRERGEASVVIGGRRFTLAINLNVLAEIEDAFDGAPFEEAFAMLFGGAAEGDSVRITAGNMRRFLEAVLRGNGVDDAATVAGAATPEEFIAAAHLLIARSGMARPNGGGQGSDRPLAPTNAGGSGDASASATSGSRRKRSGH